MTARQLEDFVRLRRVPLKRHPGGWGHLGATFVDAAFQPRQKYLPTVKPRAQQIADMPECRSADGFLAAFVDEADLASALRWSTPRRSLVSRKLAETFVELGLSDPGAAEEAAQRDGSSRAIKDSVLRIKGVGDKTADYLLGLLGNPDAVPIDSQLRTVAGAAGLGAIGDADLKAAIREAAPGLDCRPADLEHSLWLWASNGSLNQ